MALKLLDTRTINPTTAAMPVGLETISAADIEPSKVKVLPTSSVHEIFAADPLNISAKKRPLRILLSGSTGDLVGRFILPAFLSLKQSLPWFAELITFIPLGTRNMEAGQKRVDQLRNQGLPLEAYLTADQAAANIKTGKLKVDAVYVATLPKDHFEHCEFYLSLIPNVPVFCEKPLWVPEDLKQGDALIRKYPSRLYAVDCFVTATPIFWMLATKDGQKFIRELGPFKAVNGTVVENQEVEIGRLGGNLGLLRADISGGGMAIDCGIHALTTGEILFRASQGAKTACIARHFSQATYLTDKYLQKKLSADCGLKLADFRETAGVISNVYAECVVNGQGMKGVKDTAYLFEILSHKGDRVVIGIGTDSRPPYIVHIKPDGSTDIRTFASPYVTVGYEGTLYNIIAETLGIKPNSPNSDLLMQVAVQSIRDIAAMNLPASEFDNYEIGEVPAKSIPVPDVEKYVPALNVVKA